MNKILPMPVQLFYKLFSKLQMTLGTTPSASAIRWGDGPASLVIVRHKMKLTATAGKEAEVGGGAPALQWRRWQVQSPVKRCQEVEEMDERP